MKPFVSHIKALSGSAKLVSCCTFILQNSQKAICRLSKLLLLLLVFNALFTKSTEAQQYSEYEIKAAFLCNFASFVAWPENVFDPDTSVLIIGILGDDPFGSNIGRIARSYTKRTIKIERYKRVDMALNCHILFISTSEKNNLTDILDELVGTSVLTVGETEGFCRLGGMITFSKQKIKYGFEINKKAAERVNIEISSKLLRLAVNVCE
ncbi:MAG: YfiR family protein [Flavobacteriales bacterium]|nr:YfiR family protein [Flavobacteriales bacterium]